MPLPHFIIIGGMKCGSTTLYRDLNEHPNIFFPIDKEPGNLCHDHALTPEGTAAYQRLFDHARPDQHAGEASTHYTKLPDNTGVPQRAHALLGPDARYVYIVRDPIGRLLSHHKHEGSRGLLPEDPADAVRDHPPLVEYSRYATQLAPWLDTVGPDAVLTIRFEDYMKNRDALAARVCRHIGVPTVQGLVDQQRVFNKSDNKPVPKGAWQKIIHSPAYRKGIRPLLPMNARDKLRNALLPKSTFNPKPPPRELLERLADTFEPEIARLRELLGNDAPTWDLRARWLNDNAPNAAP